MKKLTAGIFTVLLGLVAANSADAAVASKGYVDEMVGVNTTAIENLSGTVDGHTQSITDLTAADTAINAKIGTVADGKTVVEMIEAAQTAASYDDTAVRGAISALETKVGNSSVADQIDAVRATTFNDLTDEEQAVMFPTVDLTEDMIQSSTNALGSDVIDNTKAIQDINNSDVMKSGITPAKVTEYDGYGAKITANETAAANAQAAAEAAQGAATQALTDAKAYADGLAGNYDAKGAAAQALTDAKTYADGLAGNYDATGSAAAAEAAAKAYADGLATNYDAAGAAAAAETAAKAYADGLAGNYDAKGSATQALTDAKAYADGLATNYDAAGSATAAAATAKSEAITAANEYTDAEVKKVDDKLADYALKSTIGEVESGKTVVQMISDAKTAATYDDTGVKGLIAANTAAAEAAQNAADAAQADADAAQGAADAAQQTADNAIPKPTGDCANANYKCVLTFNNAQYAWEVIERNEAGE